MWLDPYILSYYTSYATDLVTRRESCRYVGADGRRAMTSYKFSAG